MSRRVTLNSSTANPADLHRVFIGIGCDNQAQEQIDTLLPHLKKGFPEARWVPRLNRHLTLAFLGDISTAVLERLMGDFDNYYRQETRFRFVMSRLCRFPDSTGAIIALVCDLDERLTRLYQSTLALLRAHHLEPAWDTFRPHITLGRIRNPVRVNIDQRISIGLNVNTITIYRSKLTTSGSIYTSLTESRLG